jgi:hypothetical protein
MFTITQRRVLQMTAVEPVMIQVLDNVHPFVTQILVCRKQPISPRELRRSPSFSQADWQVAVHRDLRHTAMDVSQYSQDPTLVRAHAGGHLPE